MCTSYSPFRCTLPNFSYLLVREAGDCIAGTNSKLRLEMYLLISVGITVEELTPPILGI